MNTTVQRIAKSKFFLDNISLVAGESGLNYEVKYVTVCNSPVLSLPAYKLEAAVFVLTSFAPYHNSVERMVEMVRLLDAQNISALCVKVDTYLDELPPEVAAVCDELGLPLFTCNSKDVPFRRIIQEADKIIIGGNISSLEQSNKQYEKLYDNIMSGESVDDSLKHLAETLGCRCAAISGDEKVLGYCDPAGETHGETREWLELARGLMADLGRTPRRRSSLWDGVLVNGKWCFPCNVHNNVEGFLIVDDKDLNVEGNEELIRTTVTFISVKLLENTMLTQSMMRNNYYIIESLFYKSLDREVICHRLMLMGIEETDSFRLVGFSGDAPCAGLDMDLQIKWSWVKDAMSRSFRNVICFNIDSIFAAVVFYGATSKLSRDAAISDALAQIIAQELPGTNLRVSFSPHITDYGAFPQELVNLKKNLRYASVFAPSKSICAPNDMEQIRLVASIMDTDQYSYIKEKIIEPIREYDRLYKSELWLTLRICLELDNLGDAADALYIHKSTLRYRLQKVAGITGQNYFTSTGKFMLQVAFIMKELEAC